MSKLCKILFLFLFVIGCFGAGSASAAQLEGSWYYRDGLSDTGEQKERAFLQSAQVMDGAWQKFAFPSQPPVTDNTNYMWLMTKLLPEKPEDTTLFFTTTGQAFRVWLNGEKIYEFGTMQKTLLGNGWRWHLIRLPKITKPSVLVFEMYSKQPKGLGCLDGMSLGPEISQNRNLFYMDAICILTAPIAIVMIIIMLQFVKDPSAEKKYLYGSIISFLAIYILWELALSNIIYFLLDYPVFWLYALGVLGYVLPVVANGIVYETVEEKWKKYILWGARAYVVVFVIAIVTQLLGMQGLTR